MNEQKVCCPVYAIGPMTGRVSYNHDWWACVEQTCKRRGYEFLDARQHCGGNLTRQRAEYMRDSLRDVLAARSVILHPEWTTSAGCMMEWLVAYELGLDVYLWPSLDPWPRDDQDHAAKLARHALAAIVYARGLGGGKHRVDSYTREPLTHHVRKIETHAVAARDEMGGVILPNGEDHIALALCRAAMALEVKGRA